MLNLLRIGTGLAVVLAFVSANLWRELRAERLMTADLQAQVAASANRDYASVPAQRSDVRPDVAAPTPKTGGGIPESAPPRPTPGTATELIARSALNPERDLMNDPEFRKARLTQTRMNLKRNYTGVAEELGLSERETEQLFDILAEQQLASNVSDRQAQDAALLALLGPGRQPKWQEYQLSLSARSRATSMTGMLATSGYPLTEAQLRPLTAALIAEEKYVRQEQQPTARLTGPLTPQSMAQRQEESVNRQEESNRRYLDAAAPYMSPQQLALVRETLEQQIALSRASARMQRQRAESQ